MNRDRRKKRAEEMAAASLTADDLMALRAYVDTQCYPGDQAAATRLLGSMLCSIEGAKAAVEDVRRFQWRQAEAAKSKAVERAMEDQVEAKKRQPWDHDAGMNQRQRDMDQVRAFEEAWARYEAQKAAGSLPSVGRLVMPWERRGRL